jgi:predicted membrane-bound mannosyltransferase
MDATQPFPYDEPMKLKAQPERLSRTLEVAVYALMILLALVMRVAELDTVPLSDAEARQALAAWRFVQPSAPGEGIMPNSPLLFALHSFSFSTMGANEFTARMFTALAGVALILSPLLFRDWFGRTRTLLLSLILFFSPTVLVTSRADSPVIWTMLAAVLGLWALWRYWDTQRGGYAIFATVCLGAVLLLTDPTGPVFALILLGAAAFALVGRPTVRSFSIQM